MANKTPLQIVKEQHGSKAEFIDKVAGLVERDPGESEGDHKKRLAHVSNAKLLHLLGLAERAKEHGGRSGMVARILELRGQPKDREYEDKLGKLPLGRLVDMTESLERSARRAGRKAAPAG